MNTSSQCLFLSLIAVSLISLSAFGATTTIHPDESMISISIIALISISFPDFLYLRIQVFFLRISIKIVYIYLMTCVWRLENFQSLADSFWIVYLEKALQDIANSLGKKNWNFDTDPCSNKNWFTELENSVTCNCSVAGDNFCHVVTM